MSAVLEREVAQLSFFPDEQARPSAHTPYEEAAKAFDVALDQLAMRGYWELPDKDKPGFRRGFIERFSDQPLSKEAIENFHVFEGYWLGDRLARRWNGRDHFD